MTDPDDTYAPPGREPAPPGIRIGAYAVVRELGRGGMGVVYAAQHATLGRPVAIKLLLSDAGLDSLQRFQREAEALAQVRHPHVVAIHEVGLDRGRPYLVMDYVEGESLSDRIKRGGPLPEAEAAALVRVVAEAMQHVHARGLLHRDLKPANVLLGADGRARVTDFGLARRLGDERERLTRTGQTLGTPAFMPPEQVDGVDVDARADVYGLGATLYAALAGRPPFEGASAINILTAVMTRPPTPPSAHRPDLDRGLEAVCLKCLAKEPGERYATAGALAEDLGRWEAGERLTARPVTTRRWWVPAAVALLLVVVGVGIALSQPRGLNDVDPELIQGQVEREVKAARSAELPQDEGARRWEEIERLPDRGTRIAEARRWLAAFGHQHAAAAAARTFLWLHEPVHVFGHVNSEAIFLGRTHAVVSGRRMNRFALDAIRPRRESRPKWSVVGRYLTPLQGRSFLYVRIEALGSRTSWTLHRSDRPDLVLYRLSAEPALAVSPDGRQVAIGQGKQVLMLRLEDRRVLRRLEAGGRVLRIAWPAPQRWLTLSSQDPKIPDSANVFELHVPQPSKRIERRSRRRIAFSSSALALDASGRVAVVGIGSRLQTFRVGATRLELVPDGLFAGSGVGEAETPESPPAHAEPIQAVAIADGRVYSISRRELRVWDLASRAQLHVVARRAPDSAMSRIDAAGRRVLLSGPNGAELWDMSGVKGP